MAELRELLHAASPPAFDEADLDDLRRRVAHRRRTRRAVIVTAVVAVLPASPWPLTSPRLFSRT